MNYISDPSTTREMFIYGVEKSKEILSKYQITAQFTARELLLNLENWGKRNNLYATIYAELLKALKIPEEIIGHFLSGHLGVTHRNTGKKVYLQNKKQIHQKIDEIIQKGSKEKKLPSDFLLLIHAIKFLYHLEPYNEATSRISQYISEWSSSELSLGAYYLYIEQLEMELQYAQLAKDPQEIQQLATQIQKIANLSEQGKIPGYTYTKIKTYTLLIHSLIHSGESSQKTVETFEKLIQTLIKHNKKFDQLRSDEKHLLAGAREKTLQTIDTTPEIEKSIHLINSYLGNNDELLLSLIEQYEDPHAILHVLLFLGPPEKNLPNEYQTHYEALLSKIAPDLKGEIGNSFTEVGKVLFANIENQSDSFNTIKEWYWTALDTNNEWLENIAKLVHLSTEPEKVKEIPLNSGCLHLFHLAYQHVLGKEKTFKEAMNFLATHSVDTENITTPSQVFENEEGERQKWSLVGTIVHQIAAPVLEAITKIKQEPEQDKQQLQLLLPQLIDALNSIQEVFIEATGHPIRVGFVPKNGGKHEYIGTFDPKHGVLIKEEIEWIVKNQGSLVTSNDRTKPTYHTHEEKKHALEVLQPDTFPSPHWKYIYHPAWNKDLKFCFIDAGEQHVIYTDQIEEPLQGILGTIHELLSCQEYIKDQLELVYLFEDITQQQRLESITKKSYKELLDQFAEMNPSALNGALNIIRKKFAPEMQHIGNFLNSIPTHQKEKIGLTYKLEEELRLFGYMYSDLQLVDKKEKTEEELIRKYEHVLYSKDYPTLLRKFKGVLALFYQYHHIETEFEGHFQGTHPPLFSEELPVDIEVFMCYGIASSLYASGTFPENIHKALTALSNAGLIRKEVVSLFEDDDISENNFTSNEIVSNPEKKLSGAYRTYIMNEFRRCFEIEKTLNSLVDLKIKESYRYACKESRPETKLLERIIKKLKLLSKLSGGQIVEYIQRHPESVSDAREINHGEQINNTTSWGNTDDPLTEKGIQQMKKRCEIQQIHRFPGLKIFHSELMRSRQQTKILEQYNVTSYYQALRILTNPPKDDIRRFGHTRSDDPKVKLFYNLAFDNVPELMKRIVSQRVRPLDQQPRGINTHSTIVMYLYLLVHGEMYEEKIESCQAFRRKETGGIPLPAISFKEYLTLYEEVLEFLEKEDLEVTLSRKDIGAHIHTIDDILLKTFFSVCDEQAAYTLRKLHQHIDTTYGRDTEIYNYFICFYHRLAECLPTQALPD